MIYRVTCNVISGTVMHDHDLELASCSHDTHQEESDVNFVTENCINVKPSPFGFFVGNRIRVNSDLETQHESSSNRE